MEILLLIIGFAFVLYFISMSITAIIKKSKKFKIYILGMVIAGIIAFVGYIQIPIYTVDSSGVASKEDSSSGVKATESHGFSRDIQGKILKVNFIGNDDSGCVLIQCGAKNILVDSGKKANIKAIERSLKSHGADRLYAMIITSGDETTMGAASQLIKDYSIEDIRYVDDSVSQNNHFNEIQSAININGGEFNKINLAYNIDNITVTANNSKDATKLNFEIPKDKGNLKSMTFVKDEFNKQTNVSGIEHNVDTDCDSEGNFNITVSVYKK